MKMNEEFYDIMTAANSKYRSLRLMALHDMERHQWEYPKGGYKWNRCQKVIDKLREERRQRRNGK